MVNQETFIIMTIYHAYNRKTIHPRHQVTTCLPPKAVTVYKSSPALIPPLPLLLILVTSNFSTSASTTSNKYDHGCTTTTSFAWGDILVPQLKKKKKKPAQKSQDNKHKPPHPSYTDTSARPPARRRGEASRQGRWLGGGFGW